MAEILITGGAGFIGSHLADAHLADGDTVVVLDDLSTGSRANLPDRPGLHLSEGDVRDAGVLADLAERFAFTRVYHLAAVASVAKSVEDPLATLSVNTAGSVRMARWAVRSLPRLERFVFASSAATYGSAVPAPTPEAATLAPESPYGIEKATVERYLTWLHDAEGLPAVTARFFNVYGPRQDPSSPYSGVLSILARALRDGAPFTRHGDGGQSRDFVHVSDVVAALRTVATEPSAVGGRYNVGTGSEVTLNEVIETAMHAAGRRIEVRDGPPRPGDVRRSCADAGRLRALGWAPRTGLEDGLRDLLAWAGVGEAGADR